MTPILLFAALVTTPVPFTDLGAPMADADLAGVSAGPTGFATHWADSSLPLGLQRSPIGDEIDCWWAGDGAALIAEAVEPTPVVPAGLDLGALRLGEHGFRFAATVTAVTRP